MFLQDLGTATTLHYPGATPFCCFTLRLSGNPVSNTRDQASVGISRSMPAEQARLDWHPVNSLYAAPLDGSVPDDSNRLKCRFGSSYTSVSLLFAAPLR